MYSYKRMIVVQVVVVLLYLVQRTNKQTELEDVDNDSNKGKITSLMKIMTKLIGTGKKRTERIDGFLLSSMSFQGRHQRQVEVESQFFF